MKMVFEVNNGRKLSVFQARDDGPVYVTTLDSKGNEEMVESINPGDFVTMVNWYRYQKEIGNADLTF
ncbi:MAG: hypothetical protein P4N59_03580 [Negativicutes bacterium]|nr:hypothetical protein [Negativicutes bacterium]